MVFCRYEHFHTFLFQFGHSPCKNDYNLIIKKKKGSTISLQLELNLPLFDVTVMACRHNCVVVQPTYSCRMTQFVGS